MRDAVPGVAAPALSGTAPSGRAGSVDAGSAAASVCPSPPPATFAMTHWTNSASSLSETSWMTPRPNVLRGPAAQGTSTVDNVGVTSRSAPAAPAHDPARRTFDLDAIGSGLVFADSLGELEAALRAGGGAGTAVVQAPPGTGKTTLVPPLLANMVAGAAHGRSPARRVVVTQPRRVAARAAARAPCCPGRQRPRGPHRIHCPWGTPERPQHPDRVRHPGDPAAPPARRSGVGDDHCSHPRRSP